MNVRVRMVSERAVLALGCATAGMIAASCAAVPFSPTAPRGLAVALAAVGLVLAVPLGLGRSRLPSWVPHAVVGVATVAISGAVAAASTASGAVVTAYGFLWVAIHSALFHGRRAVLGHVGAIGVGLATGLVVSGAPSIAQSWVFVMATVGTVALVLNDHVRHLRQEAGEDPLTGASTRRAFLRTAQALLARAARRDEPISLAVVDLDDFKRVNDEGGHAAGDAVLESVTHAWRRALRNGDVLGRIGGDEFAVLLPGADERTALSVLDRMRAQAPVGWSAGVATWTGQSVEGLMRDADQCLYAAKAARRPAEVPTPHLRPVHPALASGGG